MTAPSMTRYMPLPADRPADEVERELLARWEEEDLFHRTLERHADAPPFVFFEGPPTANGRPGIHHVFARTIKDLFCRYRAMKGTVLPSSRRAMTLAVCFGLIDARLAVAAISLSVIHSTLSFLI